MGAFNETGARKKYEDQLITRIALTMGLLQNLGAVVPITAYASTPFGLFNVTGQPVQQVSPSNVNAQENQSQ